MFLCEVYIDREGVLVVDKVPIQKETEKQYQVNNTLNYRKRIDKREIGEVTEGVAATDAQGRYIRTKYVICLPRDIQKAKQLLYKSILEELKEETEKLDAKKVFYTGFLINHK